MDPLPTEPVSSAVPEVLAPEPKLVAPLWHTLLMVAILLFFSWGSAHSQHTFAERFGRPTQYVVTMAWEWILFAYVAWGISRTGLKLRDLVGGRWEKVEDFLLEIGVAAMFWVGAIILLSAMGLLMGVSGGAQKFNEAKQQLGFLIPRSALEIWLWVALSTTAGVCEEVIFRGYLQRQIGALAKNTWVGIVAAGVVFGFGHGYQGAKRMVLIAVFGMMFGTLVHLRKNLRSAMMAHGWHDAFTGLVLRMLMK